MKYDDRMRMVSKWLTELLKRYTPPTTTDHETLRKEVVLHVEDINKNIPSQIETNDMEHILNEVDGQVRANHGARTWPTSKTFIISTKEAVKIYLDRTKDVRVTSGPKSSDEILEDRIRKGEGIPDYYLKDTLSRERLLKRGNITIKDLEKYLQ